MKFRLYVGHKLVRMAARYWLWLHRSDNRYNYQFYTYWNDTPATPANSA